MRTSPTKLVSMQLYETESWMTTDRLIDNLTGEFKGNRKTQIGQAIHSILENRYIEDSPTFEYMGIIFDRESVLEILDNIPENDGVNEMWGHIDIDTVHGLIRINGRCDNIFGLTVTDYKSSGQEFHVEQFMSSLQWRCYLAMYDSQVFRYEFINYLDPEDNEDTSRMFQPVRLAYDGALKTYRYPELMADLRDACTKYIDLCRRLGIEHILEDKK